MHKPTHPFHTHIRSHNCHLFIYLLRLGLTLNQDLHVHASSLSYGTNFTYCCTALHTHVHVNTLPGSCYFEFRHLIKNAAELLSAERKISSDVEYNESVGWPISKVGVCVFTCVSSYMGNYMRYVKGLHAQRNTETGGKSVFKQRHIDEKNTHTEISMPMRSSFYCTTMYCLLTNA